jgi:hypothetical protein
MNQSSPHASTLDRHHVSVPLRGSGNESWKHQIQLPQTLHWFPSPCGEVVMNHEVDSVVMLDEIESGVSVPLRGSGNESVC